MENYAANCEGLDWRVEVRQIDHYSERDIPEVVVVVVVVWLYFERVSSLVIA